VQVPTRTQCSRRGDPLHGIQTPVNHIDGAKSSGFPIRLIGVAAATTTVGIWCGQSVCGVRLSAFSGPPAGQASHGGVSCRSRESISGPPHQTDLILSDEQVEYPLRVERLGEH